MMNASPKNSQVEFHYPFEGRRKPLARVGLFVFEPEVYLKLHGISARHAFEERGLSGLYKRMTRYIHGIRNPERGDKLLTELIAHFDGLKGTDYERAIAGDTAAAERVERHSVFESFFRGLDTGPEDWKVHHWYVIAIERAGLAALRRIKAGDIQGAADHVAKHPVVGRLLWPNAYEALRKAPSLHELQGLTFAMALDAHLGFIAAWDIDLANRIGTLESVFDCLLPSSRLPGRNPTSLFYDELQRRLGKRSINQTLADQPRDSGLEVGTLHRWSAGTHSPDFESLHALLGAYGLDQRDEVLYSLFWCSKHVHMLGHYAQQLIDIAHQFAGAPEADKLWPWPAYPFEQPTFEAWVAKRYPDWLAFHREHGASLANWAAPAPEDKTL